MKRWKRTIIYVLLAGLLSGCGFSEKQEEETGFFLYYLNAEQDQFETVSYAPAGKDTQAMVEELLQQKAAPPPKEGVLALLPESTTIRGYTLEETTLTLDLDASYNELPIGREILCRGGLVREFLQIAGVDRVAFTVAGEPLKDSYGNEVGAMTNESFVENSASTINSYQSATMTLYFTDATGEVLIPERRKVYYVSSEPLEWAVVEEIKKGPRLTGHYPTFATGTSILSVLTQEDVCYVNFASGSGASAGTLNVKEDVQLYSVVNSLVDTCGVSKVQFTIDGDSNIVFRERLSLTEQYTKNNDLIE